MSRHSGAETSKVFRVTLRHACFHSDNVLHCKLAYTDVSLKIKHAHRSLGIIIQSSSLLNYARMSDLLLQLRLVGLPSTYLQTSVPKGTVTRP